MATNLSQALYNAGKKRAVVIGHLEKANPSIKGVNTKISEQDYRFGSRAVLHNGEILFKTNIVGRIKPEVIDYYLNKKEKEGSKYDGTNNVYSKQTKIDN